MINVSNLFIRKQISDKTAVLSCSGCFLACLRPCLTRVKDIKGIKGVESSSVEDIFIGDISIGIVFEWEIFTKNIFEGDNYIGINVKSFGTCCWSLINVLLIK